MEGPVIFFKNQKRLVLALNSLALEIREQNYLLRQVMIAQTTIDASLASLSTEVKAAIALIPAAANSTPDNVVQAFVDGVSAQTAALAAVLPSPAPVAAPEPPPVTA